MDLAKYTELFRAEGREHVASMHAALLVIEQRFAGIPERARPSAELSMNDRDASESVAMLFRGAHTIKGMAATMGYQQVHDLSHALESILQGVRDGHDALTLSLVVHLFDETDALARSIERASERGSEPVSWARSEPASERASAGASDSDAGHDTERDTDHNVPPLNASLRAGTVRNAELRTRHIRVDARRLDALMTLAGELEIARGRLERVTAGDAVAAEAVTQVSRLVTELREQIITTRMVPVAHVFDRFPRLVRETARTLGRDIEFVIDGKEIELDRSMLDEIGDPVLHLLRNAIDHGIETPEARVAAGKPPRGRLTLSAQRESNYVTVRVADDGRGIDRGQVLARAHASGFVDDDVEKLDDAELLHVLTRPGFSTAQQVTEISGRGVGLDVVDAKVRALAGTLEMKSVARYGTVVTLRLPLTVAIVRALLARVADETFVVPVTHVIETIEVGPETLLKTPDGRKAALVRDALYPVVSLRETVGLPPRLDAERHGRDDKAVAIDVRGRRIAIVVDDFAGQQDVVVKPFDAPHGAPALFGGATILNDGAPALIVDVNTLV
jgi:two-component system chemotaxis sensor kinase CheA